MASNDTTVKIVVDGSQASQTLKDLTKGFKDFETNAKSATQATNETSKATDNLGKSVAGARGHLLQLIQDLAEGRGVIRTFSAQGVDLLKNTDALGATFKALGGFLASPIGLLTVFAAAIGTVAVAAVKGSNELDNLKNQLALTSDYAGATAGSIEVLAHSLAGGSITGGAMSEALSKIAASGRVAQPGLTELGKVIQKVADMTGESADKVGSVLSKAFEGNIHVIQDLNNQYHFLTAAQFAHIDALIRQGKYQEAGTETMKAFNLVIQDQKKEVGLLGGLWDSLTQRMSKFWDTLKNLGKDDTAINVDTLKKNLESLDAAIKRISDVPEDKRTAQQINLLKTLTESRKQAAKDLADEQAKLDKDNAATAIKSKKDQEEQEKILRQQANLGLQAGVDLENKRVGFAAKRAALEIDSAKMGDAQVADAKARLAYEEKIAALEAERKRSNEVEPLRAGSTNARIDALKEEAKIELDASLEVNAIKEKNAEMEFQTQLKLHAAKISQAYQEIDVGDIERKKTLDGLALEEMLRKRLKAIGDPEGTSDRGKALTAQVNAQKQLDAKIIESSEIEKSMSNITGALHRKLTEDTKLQTETLKDQRDILLANSVIEQKIIQDNINLRKQEEAEILKVQSLFGDQSRLDETQIAEQKKLTDAIHAEYDKRKQDSAQAEKDNQASMTTAAEGINLAIAKISREAKNPAEMASAAVDVMFNDMNKALDNFVTTGKGSFKEFADSIILDFVKIEMKEQVIALFKGVSGASGGGAGMGNFFSNLIGGAKSLFGLAEGGTVPTNGPVLVGEKGPEILTGAKGLNVIPNSQISSSQPAMTNVVYNINAVDTLSFQQMLARDPSFIYALSLQGQKALPPTRT